jgi:hypothetical protein
MSLEYVSDLTSAKKIKIKRSKNKDKGKNIRYHLVPESIEITLQNGTVETFYRGKKK